MKATWKSVSREGRKRNGKARGMAIPELMVAMSVFSLAVVGLISLHMFGLRQDQLVQSKLGASDQSRRALNKLLTEIRGAKILTVGNGAAASFTPIAYGNAQQGTALQISPTTDTNNYVRYFFDSSKSELRRITSGGATASIVADHLTNSMFFQAEDYRGNVLTDGTHSYVIRTVLQFYQYQYPLTKVGPGYLYDYYKLEFKAARRAHD